MHSQEWQDLYQFAISEQNVARLPQRIADARGAIFDRIEGRIRCGGTRTRGRLGNSASQYWPSTLLTTLSFLMAC